MNLLILLAALSTYINVPCADMRVEASDQSKLDSQAIYAEQVSVVEERGEWVNIRTPDTYTGWVHRKALINSDTDLDKTKTIAMVNRCAAHVYGVNDTEWGPIVTLPFECKLEVTEQLNARWLKVRLLDGKEAFIQRGDVILNPQLLSLNEMVDLSHKFLGLPYTWGGRSSFGYDCSGFVQMLYRQMGIAIPRNSRDQAAWSGFAETTIENLKPGDLIFFGPNPSRVTHATLYIGKGQIIHTSTRENMPYLRISNLTDPDWNGSSEGPLPLRVARTLK